LQKHEDSYLDGEILLILLEFMLDLTMIMGCSDRVVRPVSSESELRLLGIPSPGYDPPRICPNFDGSLLISVA
jgi:hypothetical protein